MKHFSSNHCKKIPKHSPEVAWREVDGEMILLQIHRKKLCGLNDTGTLVWRSIDGIQSITDIAAKIAQEENIGAKKAQHYVEEFIHSLLDKGLISLTTQ